MSKRFNTTELVNGIASVQTVFRDLRTKYTNSEFKAYESYVDTFGYSGDVPDDFALYYSSRRLIAGETATVVLNTDIAGLETIRGALHEYDREIKIFPAYVPFSSENLFLNIAQLVIPADDDEKGRWLINSKLIRAAHLAHFEDVSSLSTGKMGLFRQTAQVIAGIVGNSEKAKMNPQYEIPGFTDNTSKLLGEYTTNALKATVDMIAKCTSTAEDSDLGTLHEQNDMQKILANTVVIMSRNSITRPSLPYYLNALDVMTGNITHFAAKNPQSRFRMNSN